MSVWHAAKWMLLVIVVLGLAMALARTFSGPEDTWVRDEHGQWVQHGHPAGPPPPAGYQVPLVGRVLPWAMVGVVLLGLVGGAVLSRRRFASREALSRDVRFLGTLSAVALAFAVALFLGLAVLAVTEGAMPRASNTDLTMAAITVMVFCLGFLGLAALQAYGIKKLLEAHYDLKRTTALLQDTVERVARAGNSGGPSAS